jgi:hypothetical protein
MRVNLLIALLAALQLAPAPGTSSIQGVVYRAGSEDPIPGVKIDAYTLATRSSPFIAETDAQGRFFLTGLPAGNYGIEMKHEGFVQDTAPVAVQAGESVRSFSWSLTPFGAISGRVRDRNRRVVPQAIVQLFEMTTFYGVKRLNAAGVLETDQSGEYRFIQLEPGQYLIRFTPSNLLTSTQGVTYFPKGLTTASASVLDLKPGVDLEGVDIAIEDANPVTVSGAATSSDGVAGNTSFYLIPRDLSLPRAHYAAPNLLDRYAVRPVSLVPARAFEFGNVPPGEYDLFAASPMAAGVIWRGKTALTVGGSNIRDVKVEVKPGTNVTVQVFDAATGAPVTSRSFRVRMRPINDTTLSGQTQDTSSGGATFSNLMEGPYQFAIDNFGGYVSDIQQGSRSIYDDALVSVGPEAIALRVGVDLGAGARIQGTVQTATGKAAHGVSVVIFPESRLRDANPIFVKRTRSAYDGKFSIGNIPPGDYRVIGVQIPLGSLTGSAQLTPEMISAYRVKARSLTLTSGLSEDINLTVSAP